jgi:Flp pilus assembly pilin Flp
MVNALDHFERGPDLVPPDLLKHLSADEDGAALLELIGTIPLVGGWINSKWTVLSDALQ